MGQEDHGGHCLEETKVTLGDYVLLSDINRTDGTIYGP
jgi:hypothetical protein